MLILNTNNRNKEERKRSNSCHNDGKGEWMKLWPRPIKATMQMKGLWTTASLRGGVEPTKTNENPTIFQPKPN